MRLAAAEWDGPAEEAGPQRRGAKERR
jgi:hypothetical protein